jgi:hypothetical protein
MPKCNPNFQTKYAKIEGLSDPVDVDTYISGNYTQTPYCIPNNHELIKVNGTRRCPHFRHKHNADMEGTPMTQWHAEWQSNFSNTEQWFKNQSGQFKDRRADVVIEDFKRIVEIQHSPIESGEVNNRNTDYRLHGHNVIWVIDSQNSIVVKRIDKRNILWFKINTWLYENFLGCETVYYDIDGFIYKVNPNNVRSHQVDVSEPKLKSEFIDALKTQNDIWIAEEVPQSYLYIKQQGAGSGKTYGMMQLLNSDLQITWFQWIIFITKQHAAVNVMFTEFIDQYKKGLLPNIEMIGEPLLENKKYIIHYSHRITNVESCVVFATVDSFTYAVGESSKNASDQFASIVRSIKDGVSKVKRSGLLKFAGVDPLINKETIIMIDETQDLSELYGEAFLKFVSSTHTNLCVVGDRLQSLQHRENALTFLHRANSAMMKIVREEASNVVRRFSDPALIDFVNSIVPFEKYDLPPMTPVVVKEKTQGALTIFSAKTVYANAAADSENVVEAVTQIMYYFDKEVQTNNRVPESFIIITPFTGKNPLVEALLIAVNAYWKDIMENNISYIENVKDKHPYWKNINPSEYTRYAVFHKSQEMGSINLTESEHAVRMVSIHSAKGDGRPVAFALGITQSALQMFSQVAGNLIYDSLLQVAVTRQKEALYFRLEPNGDDIHQRISKSSCEISRQSNTEFDFARNTVKLDHISNDMFNFLFDSLYDNIILRNEPPKLPPLSENKLLIDMGDHNIRFASMFVNIIVHICNYEQRTGSDTKQQLYAILRKLQNENIKTVHTWTDYMNTLVLNSKNNNKKSTDKRLFIPLLCFPIRDNDRDYNRYYRIILESMLRVIKELESLGKRQMHYFCPLESVILYYMIESVEGGKYQRITINDIYNIIDTYSKVFDSCATGHDNCECKKHFPVISNTLTDNQFKQQEYLRNHYDRLAHVSRILDDFVSVHPKINWLYQHGAKFSGGLCDDNDDFTISTGYPLIGYDDDRVYIFNIKPNFNELNFNEVMTNSICDTWLISNVSKESNNYTKFYGKSITSCVLSLNRSELYTMDWTGSVKKHIDFFTNIIYQILYQKFSVKHEQYYNTFTCVFNEIDGPRKIVGHCKKQSEPKEQAKQSAEYISKFWIFLEGQILVSSGRSEEHEIVTRYTDKDTFINTLNKFLDRSLMGFLCMEE